MKRYSIAVLLIIFAVFFSCEEPYGTDPEVQRIPINGQKKLYTIEDKSALTGIIELLENDHIVSHFKWEQYYIVDKVKITIDSTDTPVLVSVETSVKQDFPLALLKDRNYIIESADVYVESIPFVQGPLVYGYEVPKAVCKMKIKELLTETIYERQAPLNDIQVVFAMLDPYVVLTIYVDMENQIAQELNRFQLHYAFMIN